MEEKPKAIIVDIDGTLCDTDHRLHHLRGDKKDWAGFYEAMDHDSPRSTIISTILSFKKAGYEILYVTGRPEKYLDRTMDWFQKYGVPFDEEQIFMRLDGDFRADTITKKEIFDSEIKDVYNVVLAIDDRPSVIRMWEENGIPVFNVGSGEEF